MVAQSRASLGPAPLQLVRRGGEWVYTLHGIRVQVNDVLEIEVPGGGYVHGSFYWNGHLDDPPVLGYVHGDAEVVVVLRGQTPVAWSR